jgi:sirohydrochlorin ferrochelatase
MRSEAVIVAHGQPSDPAGPECELSALAASVAGRMPGWTIRGVTLAATGALEQALDTLDRPAIFPFFMSDGLFIRTNLVGRLARAGRADLRVLTPFGLRAPVLDLARDLTERTLRDHGWDAAATTLILAAHGSGRSRAPAEAADATARHLSALNLAQIRTGFIEEPPQIADQLRDAGERSICLPLFVARWGHVRDDLPEAARVAGFNGVMLDPIGLAPTVPDLIADVLREAVQTASE